MSFVMIPTSFGELVDKITILEIKSERFLENEKLNNVRYELDFLNKILGKRDDMPSALFALKDELRHINETLWDIEDRIRRCEQHKDFGAAFVELARSVYITNDRRTDIKRRINELSGSAIREEKAYPAY